MVEASRSIMLVTTENSPRAETLHPYLQMPGYELDVRTQLDSAKKILHTQNFDAVIALDNPQYSDLFDFVRSQPQDYQHVLLVLITEDTALLSDDPPRDFTEVILPVHPEYIRNQLQIMLKLQQRNANLLHQKQDLLAEIALLKEELETQQKNKNEIELLKNAIVRNVSHELKTPLLQVKSAVSLIAEDAEDNTLVRYAENATARLEALVKNITMLGSSLDFNMGPVILKDAVEYARRNLARFWQKRDAAERIRIKIEPNLPPVIADKQGLSTVLQLLIDNARKFSDGDIDIFAHQEGDRVVISVQDYGIGIAKDQLNSVFDTFYQIDSSSTRQYGGTGVGLAIVKLILEHHESPISVESEVGKGSKFAFVLKVADL